jgi:hypothetical protein
LQPAAVEREADGAVRVHPGHQPQGGERARHDKAEHASGRRLTHPPRQPRRDAGGAQREQQQQWHADRDQQRLQVEEAVRVQRRRISVQHHVVLRRQAGEQEAEDEELRGPAQRANCSGRQQHAMSGEERDRSGEQERAEQRDHVASVTDRLGPDDEFGEEVARARSEERVPDRRTHPGDRRDGEQRAGDDGDPCALDERERARPPIDSRPAVRRPRD